MAELAAILAAALLVFGAVAAAAVRARRRAEAGLAAEVERRRRAESETADAHRVKSEILANVSHEIRTPINGVIGMTDLLLAAEMSAARRRQALEVIHTSTQGLLALVDDLLDFAKIEAGKLTFHAAGFRLRDLLQRVVELLWPQAAGKDLELRLEVDDELPDELQGDPARLRQVLLNLAGNAVKFTREGGVSVRVTSEGGPDDQGILHLRFAVRDTGIGISPQDQARLFAPFAQANSTAAREFGGTGLGLVISKSLVELMCGEIGFESTRGVGSTFWFRLPLQRARRPPPAFDTPVPLGRPLRPVPADAPRVLVVDDNAVNRLVAEGHLEVLGLRSESAAGGPQALERLAEGAFDAVLMDCQMPSLDGYETTRRLRRRERDTGRRVPVVGVTAHAQPGARQRALDAGMDDYLAKPFRSEDLGAVLERWLPAAGRRANDPGATEAVSEPLAAVRRLEHDTGRDLRAAAAAPFRREGQRDLETIRKALTEGDSRALARSAHALGGSADVLGASDLARLCGELEDSARAGDLAPCRPRLRALETEFDRVAAELEGAAEE